jgi:hypothetical protein
VDVNEFNVQRRKFYCRYPWAMLLPENKKNNNDSGYEDERKDE